MCTRRKIAVWLKARVILERKAHPSLSKCKIMRINAKRIIEHIDPTEIDTDDTIVKWAIECVNTESSKKVDGSIVSNPNHTSRPLHRTEKNQRQ